MTLHIRQAALNDYEAVCEVYEEIDTLHRDQLPHIFRKPEGPARAFAYYAELIGSEDMGFFVAEVDGEMAGFGHVVLVKSHEFPILLPRQYAAVDCIAIKAGFQHQGIGKALMMEMQAWAEVNGASAIELNVYEFNQRAIAFYTELGYQTVSRKMGKNLEQDHF